MVKPELAELSFPTVKLRTHRSISEAMTLYTCLYSTGMEIPYSEYPEMNGVRKRTEHLHVLNFQ